MKNQLNNLFSLSKNMMAVLALIMISFSSFAQHNPPPHGGHGGHGGGHGGGPGGGPHNPRPCNANFQHHRDSIVNGIQFRNAPGSGAATFAWDFGDGTTSTASNPSHVFPDTGFYYVCLTVTDTIGGGCTRTNCDSIRVFTPAPRCNARFIARGDSIPDGVRFFTGRRGHGHPNGPNSTTTYAWDFGDGSTSTDRNPTHLYGAAGIYYVCLTVNKTTAGGSCTATYCDSINTDSLRHGHRHHRLASDEISTLSDASVSVFPNPMVESSTIHIENTSGNVTFRLYGIAGQIVMTKEFGNGDYTITKENLNEGLYFYTVEDGNTSIAKGKLRIY